MFWNSWVNSWCSITLHLLSPTCACNVHVHGRVQELVSNQVAVQLFWMRTSALTRLVTVRKDVWCMSQLRCVNTIRCGWCDLWLRSG